MGRVRACAGPVLQGLVGPCDSIDGGRDHEFQVALREDDVGVLPVQHFSLFGNAEFAGEGVYGWAKMARCVGPPPRPTVPPRPWKSRRVTPHSRATWWRARCAFQISQVLVIMPPSLLESE